MSTFTHVGRNGRVYHRTFDHDAALSLRERGMSCGEIGEALGVKPDTVDMALRRMGAAGLPSDWQTRRYPKGKQVAQRWPTRTLRERFVEKFVVAANGCWVWQSTLNHGYGWFGDAKGISTNAHRVAWELFIGPIPEGLVLDHLCHNRDLLCFDGVCPHRRCVNPEHLEPVTLAENKRRGRQRLSTFHVTALLT